MAGEHERADPVDRQYAEPWSRGEIPCTLAIGREGALKVGEMNSGQVAERIGGQIPVGYLDGVPSTAFPIFE